ncbi:HAMP domain-containing sensor histidine kinase [Paenibacillus contaminans]|uniref:histidine kinase n=1 Tax=Paenibacillus contaminans TaxID=450362 RepID=A0A329MX88_9BACL|nr:HAMP domain-containing sensor histidine kinase [Paenibacillus contaminans]RAV23043.1 two-component sensor histidine kinase [Paenibacillus contaminans]
MLRSIGAKLLIGFFLIFLIFFFILNQMVAKNIESGNRKIITENLVGIKNNSNAYVRQSFMIHHFANDELYFGQIAEEMARDLQHDTSSGIAMYALNGDLLYASDQSVFSSGGDDFKQALQGKTAYSISNVNGTASVLFAYPVIVDGVKVGIIRFAKDFTSLYEQSAQIQRTIFLIAMAVFAAAFLFTYLLSRHITVPLVKLTKASTEVMNGKLDTRITFRRRDEIGMLASNFSKMIEKLRDQFARIEKDRDRLEELNASRKRFFDNMTHELKTPLTTIMGYAAIVRDNDARDRDLFHKGMTHIEDESKRLHGLVLKLLEMSKESYDPDSLTVVDAGHVLRDVCETMTIKAQRYIKTIHLEAGEGLFVYGHADKLRQLFINLLDNAIKYGYTHTDISASAKIESGGVRFTFANDGPTLSAEQLSKVAEPFYRADPDRFAADSAGLGLSICAGIVEEHGGSIRFASESEHTIVCIDIPYKNAEGVME